MTPPSSDERPVANAGYVVTGSGGGGSNGQYVFASLEELDDIKGQWAALHDAIKKDGRALKQAISSDLAPADDEMSRRQANALVESISKAIIHNEAMSKYAESYIRKLDAALKRYVADEEAAVARLGRVDEG